MANKVLPLHLPFSAESGSSSSGRRRRFRGFHPVCHTFATPGTTESPRPRENAVLTRVFGSRCSESVRVRVPPFAPTSRIPRATPCKRARLFRLVELPRFCSGVPWFAAIRVTLDVTLAVGASASARWLKPKAGITLPRWSRGFDPRFPLQLQEARNEAGSSDLGASRLGDRSTAESSRESSSRKSAEPAGSSPVGPANRRQPSQPVGWASSLSPPCFPPPWDLAPRFPSMNVRGRGFTDRTRTATRPAGLASLAGTDRGFDSLPTAILPDRPTVVPRPNQPDSMSDGSAWAAR
jgi:hypothetical protein